MILYKQLERIAKQIGNKSVLISHERFSERASFIRIKPKLEGYWPTVFRGHASILIYESVTIWSCDI